jgi:hypothetical protein
MCHIQALLPAEDGGLLVKVLKDLGDRLVAESSVITILSTMHVHTGTHTFVNKNGWHLMWRSVWRVMSRALS